MAAIKPHLEQQDDPSETAVERQYFAEGTFEDKVEVGVPTGLQGLGTAYPVDKKAWMSLQASHAELLRLSYARKVTLDQLQGAAYTVRAVKNEVVLTLDQPIQGAEWNAAGGRDIRNVMLLSWTKKMGTPSFALTAGVPQIGGACPGSVAGQSIVPEKALLAAQRHVTKVTGLPVSLADSICNKCYATGGNYIYGSNVLAQTLRTMWARDAVRDGSFVNTMTWAVQHADYLTDGGKVDDAEYGPERFPGRFFRIHDSGDFFSRKYLEEWKKVADRFKSGPNRTIFWAPTRIWATDWGVEAVNEINSDKDSNLVIRPSIYHVNESIPSTDLGPGWSSWSVVFSKSVKDRLLTFPNRGRIGGAGVASADDGQPPFDWDCQAYAVVDEAHSCRNARGPRKTGDGPHADVGCRACWLNVNGSINYTEH